MDRIFIEIRINRGSTEDVELEALVNDLKQRGELSDVIRAGVPLVADLQAGRLDMLFYLFPHLQRLFVQDTVLDKSPYDCDFVEQLVNVAVEMLLPTTVYRAYKEVE